MQKIFYIFILFFSLVTTNTFAQNNIMILKLTYGDVEIELYPEKAPNHVKRFKELAKSGKYDGVVFHRVIEGFMAQTGDVKYGNKNQYYPELVGQGGSSLPDLRAEFSKKKFLAGTMGMARSSNPDSANSQFFIMFKDAPHLNNKYTIVGKLVVGMDVLLRIKRGNIKVNGLVENPDYMEKVFIEN